jgi:hypothetical protein
MDGRGEKGECQQEVVILKESFLNQKRITTKITFVVDPLGSVPEDTTTKLIFITMGAQTGMIIPLKIAFVVDSSGSVPEGTTTKFIFITMGAQAGMDIPAE